jgi:hypothetical protein
MEIFTAADHGTTLSYFKMGETWHPRLKQESSDVVLKWGLVSLRDGIFKFLYTIPVDMLTDLVSNLDLKEFCQRLFLIIELLYLNPSPSEAEAIGSHPFSSDQSETWLKPFAPPFSILATLRLSIRRDKSAKNAFHTYWMEGSLARSTLWSRIVFPFYSEFDRIRNYVL